MRRRELYWRFTLAISSNLPTLYLLSEGENYPGLGLAAVVVETFLFVMINSFDCMDDLKTNFDDKGKEKAAKQFGSKFLNAPCGMFKNVVTLIFGAVVLTKLAEILGGF